ncbi:putative E3 ubiquitin-protein ligase [Sorochytrium milnesiophthora]
MTQGKCMCCNTTLTFPTHVTRFRCGVCETVNHLSLSKTEATAASATVASNHVQPLTLSSLRDQVQQAHESGKFAELQTRLQIAFGDWPTLNASFATEEKASQRHPGVDLEHVRQAWRLLATLMPETQCAIGVSMDKLLRRIGRPITQAEDLRCYLIILECPLLARTSILPEALRNSILPRLLGHLACLPNAMHHCLVNWLTQYPRDVFFARFDMINHFISYRLNIGAQVERRKSTNSVGNRASAAPLADDVGRPIPIAGQGLMGPETANTSAASDQHLDMQTDARRQHRRGAATSYASDWNIVAAARATALLFAANNISGAMPISDFYNTMIDLRVNLVVDFDSWERRSTRFCFCQYPFLLSMSAKMSVMEFEARRQMYNKFREALIASFVNPHSANAPFVTLCIRRNHIVQDSLDQLSDMSLDLKKRIRVEFPNEEGIDAGGLTKEWLMLLVKDLFDPKYGMWVVDDDSHYCWFNPASLDLQEFYLVGVIVGLAVYHSTILDIDLPLACYKKLLGLPVGMADLAIMRPSLAQGLQALLDYPGDDVEEVFCRDFVGEYESFGQLVQVPLIENGKNTPVTKANKAQYVELLVQFYMTTSVSQQFDLFRKGFLRVLQGNALSLFRPEEIQLLVRGTSEIDVGQLQAVTEYDGFTAAEPTVQFFWRAFNSFDNDMKRRFMRFLTGTDRIPATGAANVRFKISCLGVTDSDRLPIAHTCFNQLGLYKYATYEKLRSKLTMAVLESEGFGLK